MIKINGECFEFAKHAEGKSVVEFAHDNGIEIPTLCFLKDCANVGKCGLCSVTINGKKTLACKAEISDDAEIQTAYIVNEKGRKEANPDAPELAEATAKRVSKLLESHYFSCGKCIRKDSCEFLTLVQTSKARAEVKYAPTDEEYALKVDDRSKVLVIDRNKCVGCSRCVATCAVRTTTESITLGKLPEGVGAKGGSGRGICPALKDVESDADKGSAKTAPVAQCFDDTNCLLCGQCTLACPVAAIQEKSHVSRVEEALADENKHVVVAIAPAVRAALGESFGLPLGTDVTGKIYSGLRELGFDKVFDINFAADVTIMEEGTELLQRLGVVRGHDGTVLAGGPFPMYTSCCPGWIRLVDNYAPELRSNLSTAKSPQQIWGAAVKTYYAESAGVDPKDIFTVTIMPCTAKKFEAGRDGMYGASGNLAQPDIDAVLTSRELALFLKSRKIKLDGLEDGVVDELLGEYTGAGTIFGITGGVMEAAIRTAADLASGQTIENVDYEAVEGFSGVRKAVVPLQLPDGYIKELRVAVVNGAANFFELQKSGALTDFEFIEVMACPGGCIGGGGQPHIDSHTKLDKAVDAQGNQLGGHFAGTGDYLPLYIQKRASVLRSQDKEGNFTDKKRKSHENVAVQKMYEFYGANPGEGRPHELFHHVYTD